MRSIFIVVLLLTIDIFARAEDDVQVRLAVLAPDNETMPYALHKIVPSILYAVQTLNQQGGWNMQVIHRNTECSSTYGPLAAFSLYNKDLADVFLGPLCPYVLAPVARYTAVWDLPLLTAAGQNDNFDAKEPNYRLLTRMNGSYSQVGKVFLHMLKKFHWSIIALLFHNYEDRSLGNSNCYFTLSAIYSAVKQKDRDMHYKEFDENSPHVNYKAILREISLNARVIVICASPDAIREILLTAQDMGMMDNGDYVFFSVELFTGNDGSRQPWYKSTDPPEKNSMARKAYEALLTVTARVPDTNEYAQFLRGIKTIAKEHFSKPYGLEEINTYVTAFHDAVILYSLALNEALEEGYSIKNGSIITQKMWNRTFEGITGNVSIDYKGDRYVDYSLLDMDVGSGLFEVVANYYGVSQQFVDVPSKSIHWAGNRQSPPPDVPECGFDGSLCSDELFPQYIIVTSVLCGVVVIFCIMSFFIYRHFKLEAELASMTWKIRYEDITNANQATKCKTGSKQSLNRPSLGVK